MWLHIFLSTAHVRLFIGYSEYDIRQKFSCNRKFIALVKYQTNVQPHLFTPVKINGQQSLIFESGLSFYKETHLFDGSPEFEIVLGLPPGVVFNFFINNRFWITFSPLSFIFLFFHFATFEFSN